MFRRPPGLRPLEDRGPLRALFLTTSMPVGGAETLLVNLVRRLDRSVVHPEVACLKQRGPLGELLAQDLPIASQFLSGKYDPRVLPRLVRYFRRRRLDAVVTVGAGDKMFWGRLAARRAGVPVICCALHSTGWPDSIGWLNRTLTPLTDAFIAVAPDHGAYLIREEQLPADKVVVIPNGVDTRRFAASAEARAAMRQTLGLAPETPLVGTVAALRPEKRHDRFLEVARRTLQVLPQARFVIVGDGPCRPELERRAGELQIKQAVHFLGSRNDIPECLSAMDLFLLTSDNEANPVSILEALACRVPVVAPHVGSIPQTVRMGETGWLAAPHDAEDLARGVTALLGDPEGRARMGRTGRQLVESKWSLERMVQGYQRLLVDLYRRKCPGPPDGRRRASDPELVRAGAGQAG